MIQIVQRRPMPPKIDRSESRATRLNREAMNCVTFAVRERDADHAADLIDEAIKLKRRSGELADKRNPKSR